MNQGTTEAASATIGHPAAKDAAPAIDLIKFCGHDDFRPYLMTPFRLDGFVYATDGRILLRVDDSDAYERRDNVNPAKIIAPALTANFINAPRVEIPPKAPSTLVECYDCDGRGYEHDCPDCCCTCYACDGSGKLDSNPLISTDFAGQLFDVDYLRLMYSLPNLEIAPNESNAQFAAICFRFTGGVGMLMSLRHPYENHIDITLSKDCQRTDGQSS